MSFHSLFAWYIFSCYFLTVGQMKTFLMCVYCECLPVYQQLFNYWFNFISYRKKQFWTVTVHFTSAAAGKMPFLALKRSIFKEYEKHSMDWQWWCKYCWNETRFMLLVSHVERAQKVCRGSLWITELHAPKVNMRGSRWTTFLSHSACETLHGAGK